jgi:hypothetical protein
MIVNLNYIEFRNIRNNIKKVTGTTPQTYYVEDSDGFDCRFQIESIEHRSRVRKADISTIQTDLGTRPVTTPMNMPELIHYVNERDVEEFVKEEFNGYQKVISFV